MSGAGAPIVSIEEVQRAARVIVEGLPLEKVAALVHEINTLGLFLDACAHSMPAGSAIAST